MEKILPAILALVGTVITVGIGYIQWKRQNERTKTEKFQEKRHQAYEELWDMLEKIHLALRGNSIDKNEYENLLKSINMYVMANSLYLDHEDATLAREFLDKVFELNRQIAQSKNKRIKREWAITNELPSDTLAEYKELQVLRDSMDNVREKIVNRFRRVLRVLQNRL